MKIYIAMMSYILTEPYRFDENLLGAFSTESEAIERCNQEVGSPLAFHHSNVRGGYWIAESQDYWPDKRTTWFYVFEITLGDGK